PASRLLGQRPGQQGPAGPRRPVTKDTARRPDAPAAVAVRLADRLADRLQLADRFLLAADVVESDRLGVVRPGRRRIDAPGGLLAGNPGGEVGRAPAEAAEPGEGRLDAEPAGSQKQLRLRRLLSGGTEDGVHHVLGD